MSYELKNSAEISWMREAGRVVGMTLDALEEACVPGTALAELDRIAADMLQRHGATSSFLRYAPAGMPPYPKVLCTSVNDVVVHGIPDGTKLVSGDIVGLDFGAKLRGVHGDAARTVAVGTVDAEKAALISVTREALEKAIGVLTTRDARIGDIGAAVQAHVEKAGFSVVRDFVGHGIGRQMHEKPQVPNYGRGGNGERIRKGIVLALEPMVNAGTYEVEVMPDKWTVRTKDRRPSAHFEHTVALTEDGVEVLTRV